MGDGANPTTPPDGAQVRDGEIIRGPYKTLCRYARSVGPVGVDPEDLVQEALLRSLQRRQVSDLDNPGAYLRRAISNIAANERRRLS